MEIVENIKEITERTRTLREKNGEYAMVLTQGSLHAGHKALIKKAKAESGAVVVVCFINPTQFGPQDNIETFPRWPEVDEVICDEMDVDILFKPKREEICPTCFSTFVSERHFSIKLAGHSREQLFRGYATIVTLMTSIVRPDKLILGQKDYQQALVAQKVIKDLQLSTEVIITDTKRNEDGVAFGVSNQFFEDSQKKAASNIYKALMTVKRMVDEGTTSSDRIVAEMTHLLSKDLGTHIIYVAVVDPETLDKIPVIKPGRTLLMVSAWLKQIRYNDNIFL